MSNDQQAYRFGAFILDAGQRQLLLGTDEIRLRPKAFETLLYLVERHGQLVRKQELLDRVWCRTSVSEGVLTHCIAEVRLALQDDARHPRFLKTISLAGYKFIGDVTRAVSAASAGECVGAGSGRAASAIVVLPFANLSRDPDNDSFCDGLAEELINALTKVPGVRVVAHSSSFSFKGRDVDAREIGRQLGVGSILEGSVRKAGDRLRIAAQLIDAGDGYHVWSEQYDRRLTDVFAIQEEIALAILSRMTAVGAEAIAPLVKSPTRDMEAYQLYLNGRGFWHRRYRGDLQHAMECFERVIEKDPAFALAYTGLADSCSMLGIWGVASPTSVFPRATALAEKALELDSTLAEAHASRAFVSMFYDWDWAAAERRLATALELNPGNALIRLWNGHFCSIVGRWDEAIAAVHQAQEHDPLSPVVGANVGWTLSLANQQEKAVEELRKVLALDPGNAMAHFYLGYAYGEQGKYAEALESLARARATGGNPWVPALIGWVHALNGAAHQARAIIAQLHERAKISYVPPSTFAFVHLGLGEDDAVFDWLARCVEEHDVTMPWMKSFPCFDRLRPDPRFEALLRKIGLDSLALSPPPRL
jgi:serine/threonine-protein kinase